MRSMTVVNLSTSWRDRAIRSSVWQCAHARMEAFSGSVPGKLASHSELESCAARSRACVSFRSAVVVVPALTSTF